MSEIIKKYYEKTSLPQQLIDDKIKRFDMNSDIKEEFETWINTGKYSVENPVEVGGYTAQSLSEISSYLNGEGAFVLLIELRENPERAKKRIANGFKMK